MVCGAARFWSWMLLYVRRDCKRQLQSGDNPALNLVHKFWVSPSLSLFLEDINFEYPAVCLIYLPKKTRRLQLRWLYISRGREDEERNCLIAFLSICSTMLPCLNHFHNSCRFYAANNRYVNKALSPSGWIISYFCTHEHTVKKASGCFRFEFMKLPGRGIPVLVNFGSIF